MKPCQPFWNNRRVLVTGCTGLMGKSVVRALLARGACVLGLVRDSAQSRELMSAELLESMRVLRGHVEDLPALEQAMVGHEVQTVLHLAAQATVGVAQRDPVATFETNIRGTWCLLEAVRRCPRQPHVVLASSDKAYGDQPQLPCHEESPLLGRHPYDASKACADIMAQTYYATYALPVCITRCGNFFGAGDCNWNRIVPGTIRSALRHQRPVLRSDGSSVRDYLYVEDGAAAYLHLAEQMAQRPEIHGQAFNFSTESQITALEMTNRILSLMHSNLTPDVRGEARYEIRHQYLSAAKARAVLGWTPRYTLDEALRKTIDWYRDYLDGSKAALHAQPAAAGS